MTAKQEILDTVSALPESMSYEEIVRTLAMYEADRRAQDDYANGRVYTTDEANKYVRELAGL